jgi:hypothetical protein
MLTVTILLDSVEKVQRFVSTHVGLMWSQGIAVLMANH